MKTEFIRVRIEPDLKQNVHQVFKELGVTPTQVITMLYKIIEKQHSLPFELALPNKETIKTIKDAKAGRNLKSCKDVDDLIKKLDL